MDIVAPVMDTVLSEPGAVTPPAPVFPRAPRRNPARLRRLRHVFQARTRTLPSGRRRSARRELRHGPKLVQRKASEAESKLYRFFTVLGGFLWHSCTATGCIGSKLGREKMPPNGKETVKFWTSLPPMGYTRSHRAIHESARQRAAGILPQIT